MEIKIIQHFVSKDTNWEYGYYLVNDTIVIQNGDHWRAVPHCYNQLIMECLSPITQKAKDAIKKAIEDEKLKKPKHSIELELPCDVGDTIYEVCKCDDGVYRMFPMTVGKILPYGGEYNGRVWNIYATSRYTYMYKSFYDIGDTVFLTESEAKAELEECKKRWL